MPAPDGPPDSCPPDTGPPTVLVLARHAETALTAAGRWSGRRSDPPLTAAGEADAGALAGALAARLPALAPDAAAVLASPLRRCRDTAAPVAAALGLPVEVDPDLAECDFGDWDGRTFAEVRRDDPAALSAFLADDTARAPGGESRSDAAARFRRALSAARDRNPRRATVVVAHASTVRTALADAVGAGRPFLDAVRTDPAGLSIVEYWSDGGRSVRTVNDTAHLSR